MDEGVAVDQLAGGRVEEHHVADVGLVGDLDDPGQDGRAGLTLGGAEAVDDELGRGGPDAGGVGGALVARGVGAHGADGGRRGCLAAELRGGGERQVRSGVAVDRGQVALLVDVGPQHGAEDIDAPVGLRVADVQP